MIFIGGFFGGVIALAFLGHHMDQKRRRISITDIFQNRQKMFKVVTVNGPHIIKTHFFEQGTTRGHAAGIFFGFTGRITDLTGEFLDQLFGNITQAQERTGR